MKLSFLKNIEKKKLFTKADKLLLGLSGGKDSMALAHLLLDCGYTFSIAHCNFNLRGEEANADELFVREYFQKKGIEVFTVRFQTKEYAESHSCSIQMAARELRYNWFNELQEKEKFDFVLTAHHANDNVETFFINLLRGSGLNGLKGIPEKTENVVRPLLYATREKIDQYITKHSIPFREDSSNSEEKYLRNKLRNQVVPLLKEINPSLEETMSREMLILKQSHSLLSETIAKKLEQCISTNNGVTKINLKELHSSPYRELLIHEAIKQFGFTTDIVLQINESINTIQPGKKFYTQSHVLLIDRATLIIQTLDEKPEIGSLEIPAETEEIKSPIHLVFKKEDGEVILKGSNVACIDIEKLQFPLGLTKWQEGDVFYPLGMKGSKKVSDFFIGQKLSIFEKQEQWILRSGNEIVWLVGSRMDDRYKVNENTKQTLIIEWKI
ncbi:MAG: tRNA lysidine(34) synthetase TilS [Bacteroidota bacterium]|nr:tRNA lysidine(34) synthetase TilS [Bacteroidota bacterium]